MKSPLPTFFRYSLDNYTKLLLHCDGADESTTFIDSSASAHVVTAFNDAQVDTADKKFGTGSGLFDGVGDYLTIPNSNDFNFGAGDFTIDFWVKRNSTSDAVIIACTTWPTNGFYFRFPPTNTANLTWAIGGGLYEDVTSTGTVVNDGLWHHIAVVRNGNSWKIYINGINDGTAIHSDTIPDSTAQVMIASAPLGGLPFNGWLDELRVSKGIARWTENFTPPTHAY